jgi:hypothetical protein
MDQTLWTRTPLATRPSRYDTAAFAIEDIVEGTIVIPQWNEASDGEGGIRQRAPLSAQPNLSMASTG